MRKTIVKGIVFFLTFLVSLLVIGKVMNKDHDNMTMEMAEATLPVFVMEKAGVSYNTLFAHTSPMDIACQRETVTVLSEGRDTAFSMDTYGRNITAMEMEVRSTDGERLIEQTPLTDWTLSGRRIEGRLVLKDLIEKDREYSLMIRAELDGSRPIYYYTRVVWSDSLHELEQMQFALDFHKKTFDRESARELTRYLETNSRLEENKSFHKVNIHSSFKQLTWGDLGVAEFGAPRLKLVDIAGQTASMVLDYMVYAGAESSFLYYRVQEYFRVRYTADRMYLLGYERTMEQIPEVSEMYANNKILFGITGENPQMVESPDGNVVVFVLADRLCSYNVTTNKLAVIFSFYQEIREDERYFHNQHAFKILDVDEGGSVSFAVYGYMNRGRHEGETGLQIMNYDSAVNTVEEVVYLPYTKPFSMLQTQLDALLYLNRDGALYFCLDQVIYRADLESRTCQKLVDVLQDDVIHVSEDHHIMVWQEGDAYRSKMMHIRDLNTDTEVSVEVAREEVIRPLGFIGEDMIYGIAKEADISRESSGHMFVPMYRIVICDVRGRQLKVYEQENIYVTECIVEDNQITLERVLRRDGESAFQRTLPDHIMNNIQQEPGKNVIVTADIETYERYVQLQVRGTIDAKTIQILTPKEVVFEGGREMQPQQTEGGACYYVYGPYGVSGIFRAPANAIRQAYNSNGVVLDEAGDKIWIKGNRLLRNQIMAIKEPERTPEGALAVCLDTMMKYEGFVRESEPLLARGDTVPEILQNNMPDMRILDLSGCPLDAVLYYVNRDIPVLALLKNGDAVLLTGFNEYNVVLFEPSSGRLYKNGMNDTARWLEENGNCFITYQRTGS